MIAKYLIGDIAETRFLYDCARQGLNIASPRASQKGWDFIVVTKTACIRVQVKYASPIVRPKAVNVSYTASLTDGNFDVLAVWMPDREKWYFLKSTGTPGRKASCRPVLLYVDSGPPRAGRPKKKALTSAELNNWEIFSK